MHIFNSIKPILIIIMLGSIVYLLYVVLQPNKAIVIVNEADKQLAMAWKWEFEMLRNYTTSLEKTFAEKERLFTLCNGYVYPSCPPDTVKLTLFCTKSMLPTLSCNYPDIRAFTLDSFPKYEPQVCDLISYDLPTPLFTKDADGKNISLNRIMHRIIAVNEINRTSYITRGDANEVVDDYSPRMEDVRYVYCR